MLRIGFVLRFWQLYLGRADEQLAYFAGDGQARMELADESLATIRK